MEGVISQQDVGCTDNKIVLNRLSPSLRFLTTPDLYLQLSMIHRKDIISVSPAASGKLYWARNLVNYNTYKMPIVLLNQKLYIYYTFQE